MTNKKEQKNKKRIEVDLEPVYDSFDSDDKYKEEIKKIEEEFADLLSEAPLSVGQRIKKRQQMRRYRSRINIARKRSLRRKATTQRLERRARKSAITATKRRFSGGKSLSNLSYSERARVERMTSRHKTRVTRLARRLVRVKRQQERDRIVRRGSR